MESTRTTDNPSGSNLEGQNEESTGTGNARSMSESAQALPSRVVSTGQEALQNIQAGVQSMAGRRETTADEKPAQGSRPDSEEIQSIDHMDETKIVEYLQEKHRSDRRATSSTRQ